MRIDTPFANGFLYTKIVSCLIEIFVTELIHKFIYCELKKTKEINLLYMQDHPFSKKECP